MSFKACEWWPLGGLGEVGMNCMVFKFGELVIPVDAGMLFADANDFGIQVLYPDFRELLSTWRPKHWIITHGHEDHIGAVSAVFQQCEELGVDLPLFYAPPFASELIKDKLLDSQRLTNGSRFFSQIKVVPTNCILELDDLKIHFLETRHSTPDTCSIAFEWKPPGCDSFKIVHTSDFKIDVHEFEDGVKTAELYNVFDGQQADLLFIDSTNAEREGTSVSEIDILVGLEEILKESSGRVYVTLFSSNVYRIAQLMQMAHRQGRFVCLSGKGLQTAFQKAEQLGMLGRSLPPLQGVRRLEASEMNAHPPSSQLIICSGSQGEQRSALARLAQNQHADFRVEKGDTVIFSSMTIPGNEKSASRVINGLIRQGAKIHYSVNQFKPIHASGHAKRDEIRAVSKVLRPRYVVPVHGELRQLSSCVEAIQEVSGNWNLKKENFLVCENGDRLQFEWNSELGSWNFSKKIPSAEALPRMLRFEQFSCGSKDSILKDRKKAALGGVVSAWICHDGTVGAQVRGILPEGQSVDVLEIERWLASEYSELESRGAFSREDFSLENEVADNLSRFVRRLCGIRPFAMVHIIGKKL
jgi:ribonuclease J